MSQEIIRVDQLSKTYKVPEREGGFGAAVGSFFKRNSVKLFSGLQSRFVMIGENKSKG